LFFVNLYHGKKNSTTVEINIACECVSSTGWTEVQCTTDPFADILPHGFLAVLWPFAETLDFFQPFDEYLHVPMKKVDYSNLDRIKAMLASIIIGCKHGKDVNHELVPYAAAAQCCGMAQFPDQSLLNRFLRHFDLSNISELDYIFESLLQRHGLCQSPSVVDIDFDCTGLVVHGNTYQFARKGYFPHQRSARGYHLSLATTANVPVKEILSLHLDPGNRYVDSRFWDAIYQVASILGDLNRIGVIRADSASGSGANIEALVDHQLSFLIKGNNCRTAEKFARKLCHRDWIPLDFFIRIADLDEHKIPNCRYPVRVLVVETITSKGKKYTTLYTLLNKEPEQLFQQYNERQNIESIIKQEKHGLYITNFRTRQYLGILSFLYMSVMCYNLISWFRYHVLKNTGLGYMSTTEIINTLMDIPAKIKVQGKQLTLAFPENHELCKKYFHENDNDHTK